MKKNTTAKKHDIEHLSLENVRDAKIHNIGEEVMLLDGLETGYTFPPYFRTKLPQILILTSGNISGRANLRTIHVEAPAMIIIMPEQILEFTSACEKTEGFVLQYSLNFYNKLGLRGNTSLRNSFNEQQAIKLNETALHTLLSYIDLLKWLGNQTDNPYRLEAALNLTRAYFYGLGYFIHQNIEDKPLSRNELLVEQFEDLLVKHCREIRKLSFYAEKLNISEKHLSNLIKKQTGQPPGKWIEDFIVLETKALLTTTQMTVSQIADHLHFPDQSTLGKYFKRATGLSPKQFRISSMSGTEKNLTEAAIDS